MTFTILFFGLIAHIVVGNSQTPRRAVFINPEDAVHNAVMVVHCADIVPLLSSSDMQCGPTETDHEFAIGSGRHFRVNANGASGDPSKMASFDSLVPHLSKLIDVSAALTSAVKFAHGQKRVSTYLDYQGGHLVATNNGGPYPHAKVMFDYPSASTQCVATVTGYVLKGAQQFVVIEDSDDSTIKLTLKGSATVIMRNTPIDQNVDDHFADYNWITESTKIAHLSPIDNSCPPQAAEVALDSAAIAAAKHSHYKPRDRGKSHPHFVTAECTNSQYP